MNVVLTVTLRCIIVVKTITAIDATLPPDYRHYTAIDAKNACITAITAKYTAIDATLPPLYRQITAKTGLAVKLAVIKRVKNADHERGYGWNQDDADHHSPSLFSR